jgi:hypothetical protein
MAERPVNYTYDPPPGVPRSNAGHEVHRVSIRNARLLAEKPQLDRQGFALVEHRSAVVDFHDEDEVRRRVPGVDDRDPAAPRQPATRVHVDHTARSGPQRVRDLLPDEADELLRHRLAVINVWRPLQSPLLDAPLAVCDARSVAPEDLVPSDLVYPHRTGETYSVTYNPAHHWFYVPAMRADEALLIKCVDTARDGRARFTPHTSFEDPNTPSDAPPRESIELRALVFIPSEPGRPSAN